MSVEDRYPDTSTNRTQRIAIWVIAIALIGSTIIMFAGFLVFQIFFPNTDQQELNPTTIAQEKWLEEYQKAQEEQTKAEQAQAAELAVFGGYTASPFEAASVGALDVQVLKPGTGSVVAKNNTISAYYTGWTPDGRIFDSTATKSGSNETRSFSLQQVITGWTDGLSGQKVGGVYQLTIPSEQAYGASGSGALIPPNTPLRFVVEIVAIES
jgi:FKBP-type peptidyl-prolyl cis-trans isomerase